MRQSVDILTRQFDYIKSCINDKGEIIDKKLKSPLDFQYHYTSFILASVLIDDDQCLNKVVEYYLSISKERMRPSNEFNVFLLLLAISNDENKILDKYKDRLLKSIYHQNDDELYKLNNNFRALRLVGLILEDKINQSNKNDKKIAKEVEWIINLQFDDGFFPDSNMEYDIERNRGVPHLIYHSKISMCLGLVYNYIQDERLLVTFNNAIDSLLNISIDNYYFFYGRSTNSIFGYASFYLSLIFSYKFNEDKKYLIMADEIFNFIKQYQYIDGHISINLNKNDSKRLGYDAYMYEIVYNIYSNAIFLYANKLKKEIFSLHENKKSQLIPKVKVYKDSGFVIYKNNAIKYCFNYKGHQDSLKYRFDSRVSPFSLLYFEKCNENSLPAIGYKPVGISPLVNKRNSIKDLYVKFYHVFYYDWWPIFGGNTFFYIRNGFKYYPFRCLKSLKLGDVLILKFESRTRSLLKKSELTDYFVISIKLQDEIKYKILFYDSVDSLFYTYREIENEKNFSYYFSDKYRKLFSFSVETSNKMADLYRCKFSDLKCLEIEVKAHD